jgi:hypothetical protein
MELFDSIYFVKLSIGSDKVGDWVIDRWLTGAFFFSSLIVDVLHIFLLEIFTFFDSAI